ncbi:DUF3298 and DUF4163 domain-containing protein [soil metagenome]
MTSPLKRPAVLIGGAVALVAAGAIAVVVLNNGGKPAPAPTPASTVPTTTATVTPAEAAAPFDFKSDTPYAVVELKLPQSIKGQPDLHAKLFSAGVRDLRAFSEGSQADRSEAGGDSSAPYEKTIAFDTGVETGKLFSLARTDYEFTGGAHGNATFAGVLWDKALKQQVTAAQLFRTGADLSALDTALCAALNTEKKSRDPAAEVVTLGAKPDGGWACPAAADVAFILAAGTAPGKAGGLTFMVGPYIVGPYSDGAYWVNVPQAVIRPLLAPAYADEFAGDPTPLLQGAGH